MISKLRKTNTVRGNAIEQCIQRVQLWSVTPPTKCLYKLASIFSVCLGFLFGGVIGGRNLNPPTFNFSDQFYDSHWGLTAILDPILLIFSHLVIFICWNTAFSRFIRCWQYCRQICSYSVEHGILGYWRFLCGYLLSVDSLFYRVQFNRHFEEVYKRVWFVIIWWGTAY